MSGLFEVAAPVAMVAAAVAAVLSEGFPPVAATCQEDLQAVGRFPIPAAQHLTTGLQLHRQLSVDAFPAL